MGVTSTIRPCIPLIVFAISAASCLACAKGTEISQEEIVFLPLLPQLGADAGADAGAPPSEPAQGQAEPLTTDAEP